MLIVLKALFCVIELCSITSGRLLHSKAKLTSLFLKQLQPQQNELKLETQNAQNREKSLKFSHQIINPVAETCRETAKGP